MESSSPQRRRDRGGDAEVNRDLQLCLRCLGGLCASAVNSIYSHAFLKALIVNNFNLHTLHINGTSECQRIKRLHPANFPFTIKLPTCICLGHRWRSP